jgi:hypothetical protein
MQVTNDARIISRRRLSITGNWSDVLLRGKGFWREEFRRWAAQVLQILWLHRPYCHIFEIPLLIGMHSP